MAYQKGTTSSLNDGVTENMLRGPGIYKYLNPTLLFVSLIV